jgi:hypothetical protein
MKEITGGRTDEMDKEKGREGEKKEKCRHKHLYQSDRSAMAKRSVGLDQVTETKRK